MDFMTIMQQRAIKIIEKLPDDKVCYVISILEGIEGLQSEDGEEKLTKSQIAYQNLQHFRKRGSEERDYKEELWESFTALKELHILAGRLPEDFDCDKEIEEALEEKYGWFTDTNTKLV